MWRRKRVQEVSKHQDEHAQGIGGMKAREAREAREAQEVQEAWEAGAGSVKGEAGWHREGKRGRLHSQQDTESGGVGGGKSEASKKRERTEVTGQQQVPSSRWRRLKMSTGTRTATRTARIAGNAREKRRSGSAGDEHTIDARWCSHRHPCARQPQKPMAKSRGGVALSVGGYKAGGRRRAEARCGKREAGSGGEKQCSGSAGDAHAADGSSESGMALLLSRLRQA
ncbi:hypothetical protein B0H15DRAFT_806526 [Mycena belliarum]|uniref:Uncharacterized protein n=1 Tax=Mycena belliarum TaxID=1033014 RepID=A0AAD6TR40_9AGAR|nr:hypothetical protein B0H15DRAFT_806526 [Mycena belliae]